MSRSLPARPNLEFLKKEAKEQLDQLRRADPSAQLSAAQHALAIEYGFASWPKLKAHVEALDLPAAASPLAGGWIADVARSRRHPSNPFRSGRIHFTVRGNTVQIVDEFVDETGKAIRGRNTLEADGVERPIGSGYGVRASWIDAYRLQAEATKDGQPAGRVTYTVSPDESTMTITDDSGGSTIVLDRQVQ